MFKKALYILLFGLVGGALVHIAIVLAVPVLSENDAWSFIKENNKPYEFAEISRSDSGRALLRNSDPLFRVAACHFDLSEGPVHLQADGDVEFWSLSLFGRDGTIVFSFNDRNASERKLDIIVATKTDATALQKSEPSESEQSFLVSADIKAGYAILRVFQPDASWTGLAAKLLRNARCDPI